MILVTIFSKKPFISGLNYDRPDALTSVVIKSLERLVLAHLKDITGPLLDPLPFAYWANRSVDDAVNMGLLYILQHFDSPGTHTCLWTSPFNIIIPDILSSKLTQLTVPASTCQSPSGKRSSRGCTSCSSSGSSTCLRNCWSNFTPPLFSLFSAHPSLCGLDRPPNRTEKRAENITADPSHPGHNLFELLPSGRRYRALYAKTTGDMNSFFPQAVTLMNS